MNCCVAPALMLAVGGATAMDESVGGGGVVDATVRDAFPLTPLSVAVIVAEPAAAPVASPAALMVAIVAFDEVQLTDAVMFFVVPSL